MASTRVEEKRACRALLLLPVAIVAGAVLGPVQYLLFYAASDSLEVARGLAVLSLIGGAVLGVFIGAVAGVVGYLLAGSCHGLWASAFGVTLIVAVSWVSILYPCAGPTNTVRSGDLVVPACTAFAAGLFILIFLRTPVHTDTRDS